MKSLFLFLLAYITAPTTASLTYRGVDWSSLAVEEAAGKRFSDLDGVTKPLEKILINNGVNTVRQRLWFGAGSYDLQYNLALAKRAHAAGLQVYLDIFFSETWTDPGHQTTPTAWAGLGIAALAAEIQSYTQSVMNSFQSAGVPLAMVAIGNEITEGLLWPLGKMSTSPANVATLLHAASAGIKASSLATKPKIIIHLDNGWNWATQEWWYNSVLAAGPLKTSDFDVQGVSYYPFYNSAATLAALKTSLGNIKAKYGKEVMVVETDWPSSCPKPAYAFPVDTKGIPWSEAGQATWIKDVASVVQGAGGDGFFYWEPTWVDNAPLGSSCAWVVMFGIDGKPFSSINVFKSI
ncbi:hypothetical protein LTR62_000021 [Meristemomyces frigidus]|uniref:Arabinogalactan endo-beta-1,4-galactanase n=1 Tax=Meristemomyces frigidus TaxID=1508187 RepID=A0AAN7YNL0_9PEZI|nr:hypothetical protein LTR62_000021 [Meristemomyces frigidus]